MRLSFRVSCARVATRGAGGTFSINLLHSRVKTITSDFCFPVFRYLNEDAFVERIKFKHFEICIIGKGDEISKEPKYQVETHPVNKITHHTRDLPLQLQSPDMAALCSKESIMEGDNRYGDSLETAQEWRMRTRTVHVWIYRHQRKWKRHCTLRPCNVVNAYHRKWLSLCSARKVSEV